MAYCTKCGKEVQEGDTFCHACGAAVKRSEQAAAPAPPMPPGSAPAAPAAAPMPPAAPQMSEEDAARQRVERRLKDRTDLFYHIGAYVIVNTFIIIVWALTGAGYPWFIWTLAPWGVGLAFHIFAYFMGGRNEAARERMVQKEMEKMQTTQQAVSGETETTGEDKS